MAVQQQINKFIRGIGASPGIIIGKAYLIERFKVRLPQKQIDPGQVEEKVNAEWGLDLTLEKLDTAFKAIEDEYLRERRSDLHYVAARIFRNLLGKKHDDITKIKGKVIVVAHDLSPADTLQMNLKHVAGFIPEIGGRVSHTAILARSLC